MFFREREKEIEQRATVVQSMNDEGVNRSFQFMEKNVSKKQKTCFHLRFDVFFF